MMDIAIRHAEPRDASAIRDLLVAAFSGTVEAGLVADLAEDGDLALALIAEEADAVVGYVAYSPLSLDGGYALAPLAVAPPQQNRGIGSALVETGHRILRERGSGFVLVLGDPAYYGRFGFSVSAAAAFQTPYDGPYLQALFLSEQGRVASGKLSYANAFQRLGGV